MYVLDAPRNVINYRDCRATEIHVSTTLKNNEKNLRLKQGQIFFAPTHAGNDGLYQIVIKPITISFISLTDAKEVCLATWAEDPKARSRNLVMHVSVDAIAKPDLRHI